MIADSLIVSTLFSTLAVILMIAAISIAVYGIILVIRHIVDVRRSYRTSLFTSEDLGPAQFKNTAGASSKQRVKDRILNYSVKSR